METFVGDTVLLMLDTGISLAGYTTLLIKYRKPDGVTGVWEATVNALDNNIMEYTTVEADLDTIGEWQLQAFAEGATFRGHGRICELKVQEVLIVRDDVTTLAPTTLVPTTV